MLMYPECFRTQVADLKFCHHTGLAVLEQMLHGRLKAAVWQRKVKSYLGPKSSVEHSLRFRDSALAGSDEFSPTPLILNAYQRL